MFWAAQKAESQEFKERSLLKLPIPRPNVGSGPDMWIVLPQLLALSIRLLKWVFRTSDWFLAVSFVPTWKMMLSTVGGREDIISGNLFIISGTVDPGKHFVSALTKLMFFKTESPTRTVEMGNRGGTGGGLGERVPPVAG